MSVRFFALLLMLWGLSAESFAWEGDGSKKIEIKGEWVGTADAVFVGEIHEIKDGQAFIFEMVRKLHAQNGTTRLVVEWGKSKAWMYNAFLTEGDSTVFDYYKKEPNVLAALPNWKALYNETGIELLGIDFERSAFAYAVLALFRKHPAARDTRFYNYLMLAMADLEQVTGDISGKKVTVRCYKHARRLFAKQKDVYRRVLGNDFLQVAEILENPARQNKFNRRDEAMAENLTSIDAPFLCVMGLAHTSLLRKSVLKRYIENPAHGKPLVVDMVCRNCFTRSYTGSRVVPMLADYEYKNVDYMSSVFDSFYDSEHFPVIEQRQFKGLPGGYSEVPTYYVLFKDQPEW